MIKMKKGFTLVEIIFVILIIEILVTVGVVISEFSKIRAHSVIESMSYTLTTGVSEAVELAQNYMDLENNKSFKLGDVLQIDNLDTKTSDYSNPNYISVYGRELVKGLRWHYTTRNTPKFKNRDGTFDLKDTTYSSPRVVLRITLDKDERVIRYRINCKNIKKKTHPVLRELCIKKWGDKDIQEDIHF